MGSRGEDPIGGLLHEEPPKLILILEIDVKVIFYKEEIENAYTDIQLIILIGWIVI